MGRIAVRPFGYALHYNRPPIVSTVHHDWTAAMPCLVATYCTHAICDITKPGINWEMTSDAKAAVFLKFSLDNGLFYLGTMMATV